MESKIKSAATIAAALGMASQGVLNMASSGALAAAYKTPEGQRGRGKSAKERAKAKMARKMKQRQRRGK